MTDTPISELTLRDWFAGQVIVNMDQSYQHHFGSGSPGDPQWYHLPNQIAMRAYAIADAMMLVRSMK